MVPSNPCSKVSEVVPDALVVGVEDVGAVLADANPLLMLRVSCSIARLLLLGYG